MLYRYKYPVNHKLGKLNEHLLYFFSKIRVTKNNSQFIPAEYFKNDFVLILNKSEVLKEHFKLFFETFKTLNAKKKQEFYLLVLKSQNIEIFFSNINLDCNDIKREPIEAIIGNQTLRSLLSYLFTTTLKTDEWDIKGHYKIIYDAMKHKVCPFCGIETMHKSFREDYDHIAPKRHYPLIAIHPKNLAPMCHTCNSKYKGEKDVLYKADGNRRSILYPYTQNIDITINYTGSIIPQTDKKNVTGNWVVNIMPDNENTKNWNDIFGIKKRYKEDYVSASYEDWLNDFLDGLIFAKVKVNSIKEIRTQMEEWAKYLEKNKFQNTNLIKAPLFRFFSNCNVELFMETLLSRYYEKVA